MDEQVMETKNRPTFITVLGILSFIGVGWQIISGIITTAAGAVASSVISAGLSYTEDLSKIEGTDQAMTNLNETVYAVNGIVQNITLLGIINIVAALVCLLGVIWMWKLMKKGFYVYVIGELAAPIATFVLVGFGIGDFIASLGSIFPIIFFMKFYFYSAILAILSLIVPIIFIILYAINLKHMS